MQVEFVERTPLDAAKRAVEEVLAGGKLDNVIEIAGLFYIIIEKDVKAEEPKTEEVVEKVVTKPVRAKGKQA